MNPAEVNEIRAIALNAGVPQMWVDAALEASVPAYSPGAGMGVSAGGYSGAGLLWRWRPASGPFEMRSRRLEEAK